MPDYAVRNTETGDVRIVAASRPASALSHVVTPLFSVTLATAADGIEAGKQGRRIEIAGEEAEPVVEPTEQQLEQSMIDAFAAGQQQGLPNDTTDTQQTEDRE